ncbi:hypothetical protein [Clostridium pasteurianum]|nr:hypothetical protein [Clostridium pasteurianum]
MKVDAIFNFDLESESRITINDIMYREHVVSRIIFRKYKSFRDNSTSLFIEIFMGNLELGTIVSFDKDYVLIKHSRDLNYTIRIANEYDYPKKKINPLQRVQ